MTLEFRNKEWHGMEIYMFARYNAEKISNQLFLVKASHVFEAEE